MISFIIPVYNTVEEYIDRCINSICNAGFGDFELIVVNDGSSEEISDYLRKLVVRFQRLLLYNNIRLIEKQNCVIIRAEQYRRQHSDLDKR